MAFKHLPTLARSISKTYILVEQNVKFHLCNHNYKKFGSRRPPDDGGDLDHCDSDKKSEDCQVNLQELLTCNPEKKTINDSRNHSQLKTNNKNNSKAGSLNPGRHGYHEETECIVNQQIFAELNAAFAYLSMACYFGRTEVALPGCQGFFTSMHEEEMGHAKLFINYQLTRGGHVRWFPISIPESDEFNSVTKAFCVATEMEKLVKEKLQTVYEVSEKHQDLELMDLISKFMEEQNISICEMARLQIRAMKMCNDSNGEFLFDKEMFKGWVKKPDTKHKYK